jgi:hypothetical protein
MTASPRKKPKYMTNTSDADIPLRFMPEVICRSVDELIAMRVEVCEEEPTEFLQCFLQAEVAHLAEIIDFPLFTEQDEIRVYTEMRARAVAIEQTVYDLMYGKGNYQGIPQPEWRWIVYQPILLKVREISVIRSMFEENEDDEDDHDEACDEDQTVVTNQEPRGLHVEDV